MNDAFGVCGLKRGSDLYGQTQYLAGRQRTFGQGLAVHQLHHNVVGADVIDLADVGMVERGYGFGFARKSIAELGSRGFDRDKPIEARISGTVDFAHTAFAEQRENLVRTETVTFGKRHGLVELESTASERGIAVGHILMAIFSKDRGNHVHPSSSEVR